MFYVGEIQTEAPFRSKDFSNALGITRVSFAPAEQMEHMLGYKNRCGNCF